MKRCPECYEAYDDEQRFCETDGHELLADPTYSPEPTVEVPAAAAKQVWWPAAALGILVGLIFGAGLFAVAFFISTPDVNERPTANQASEVPEKVPPSRVAAPAPTPEPEESPSPDSEEEAEAEPSPAVNAENKTPAVQLNRGPISTGQKIASGDGAAQTVIEMNDGSTLDVDAAWEDQQGIWYRRSGLVSFVDSSRVKAITSRRETKAAEGPHR